jgi:type II secretory pathway pseudopilin PulG
VSVLDQLRESSSAQAIILVALVAALAAIAIYFFVRSRQPKDKEKRRRLTVNQLGRIGDAMITDVQDNTVFYEYSVRGVIYTASQDIAQLRDRIPTDPDRLIGPCGLKYSTSNPANSIIVCEEWSGLRINPIKPTSELSSPQGV